MTLCGRAPEPRGRSDIPDPPCVGIRVGHDGKVTTPLERPSARVIVIDGTQQRVAISDQGPSRSQTPALDHSRRRGQSGRRHSTKPQHASSVKRLDWPSIPTELGDPVATCRGEWTFRGQPLYSVETFFAWRTDRFELSTAGMGATGARGPRGLAMVDDRRDRHHERTHSAGTLGRCRPIDHAGRIGSSPIELPWVNFDAIEVDASTGRKKG